MDNFKIGDIVTRKSYGEDIYFSIANILQDSDHKPLYILKGIMYRIEADTSGNDLVKQDSSKVRSFINSEQHKTRQNLYKRRHIFYRFLYHRLRAKPGKILHIDSSRDLMDYCIKHYDEAKLSYITQIASENEQPNLIRRMLEKTKPDILVVTGHDGIRKDTDKIYNIESYRNSKYFVDCVKKARKYEPDYNNLCIFAGACQSYYEAIMDAGANFASSPGRILINGLDPAIVSEKIALTDKRRFVTPREIGRITISGSRGIGGVNTRGHLS